MVDWLQTGSRASGMDWINSLGDQRTTFQAGRDLASGNVGQAANTMFQGGNLQGGLALQDRQRAQGQEQEANELRQRTEGIQFARQATTALGGVIEQGGDVLQAFDQYTPAFEQMGVDRAQIGQLRERLAADPQNFLTNVQQVLDQQERELRVLNLGGGGFAAVDTRTGEVVNERQPFIRPLVVGNRVINPETGALLYEGEPDADLQTVEGPNGEPIILAVTPQGAREVYRGAPRQPDSTVLSDAEVQALNLPPGVYQRNRQGQISEVAPRAFETQRNQERAGQQEAARFEALQNKIDSANTALSRARQLVSGWSTGTAAQVGGIFTRQARADLAGQVDTLKAIFSFSELQQMRENSPTGGALGNVSNIELNLLGSTIASMNQEMSPEEFNRSLDIIDGAIQRWQTAVTQWQQQQGGSQGGATQDGPRVRFELTPQQRQAWGSIGTPSGNRGARTNPIVINPQDPSTSYGNVPSGGYFITPDGQLRGPKP